MKKVIFGMGLLMSTSAAYATEYNCNVTYNLKGDQSEIAVNVPVTTSITATALLKPFNTGKASASKTALIDISTEADGISMSGKLQYVTVTFVAPELTSIGSSDDSLTALTARDQSVIEIYGAVKGKQSSLICSRK